MNKDKSTYDEIIKNLSSDALEIIAASLWPEEMKTMLLHAPLSLQKIVIDGALSEPEIINALNDDALEIIGGLLLADEMKEMLIAAPQDLRKQIVDDYLNEQKRISNLN